MANFNLGMLTRKNQTLSWEYVCYVHKYTSVEVFVDLILSDYNHLRTECYVKITTLEAKLSTKLFKLQCSLYLDSTPNKASVEQAIDSLSEKVKLVKGLINKFN